MLGICFSFYISIFFFLCIIFVILFKKLTNYKLNILYILFLLIIASLYGSIRLEMYNNVFNNIDEITVTGEVLNLEKETEMNNKYIFKVKNYYMYLYISKNINLNYGDILKCVVNIEKPLTNSNEGTFNNRNYMYSNNIVCTAYVKEICSIGENDNNIFKIINNVKKYLINQIEKSFNEKDGSLIKVMLLNDNSNINKEVKNLFYNTGLAHILVPSSTHLTYILFMVSFLLSMFDIKSRTRLIINTSTIFIYLVITNFAISIMRILLMFMISNVFSFYIIKLSTLNKICLALLILLVLNPLSIFNVGLLLSFGSVIGILFFNKKIYNKCNYIFNKNNNNVLSKIIMALSVTLSVNIFILPIVLCNFNKIYILGIISNIFIIPLSGFVIVLSLVLFIFLNIPIISNVLIYVLSFIIQIIFGILDYFNGLPFVSIPFVTLNVFEICMYYFCVIDIFVTQKYIKLLLRRKKIIAFIVVTSMLYSVFSYFRLEIDFIDVGQGDSAYISTFAQKILIDGGGIANSDFDIGERVIMPFLLNRKVLSLDYVIVTHFDYDHYGGLIYLINNFSIKNIVVSKQFVMTEGFIFFIEAVKEKNINIMVVEAGDIIYINKNVYIYILYPDNKYISDNINNNSIVCKFIYYEYAVLFTGDIQNEVEEYLIKSYGDMLKADLLKIAHHGSNTSSNKNFINLVNPDISIISVGRKNRYGHPNIETINNLIRYSSLLLRTDMNGQVSIYRFFNLHNYMEIMYNQNTI